MHHHHLVSSTITMSPPPSSSKPLKKPSNSTKSPNYPCSTTQPSTTTTTHLCNHSPSATLDLLIFILVLFSGTFLIISYFSYIFQSLSLLLPYPPTLLFNTLLTHLQNLNFSTTQYIFYTFFLLFFILVLVLLEICCGVFRSRKCGKPGCKGLRKAMEFDLQLQGQECLRSETNSNSTSSSKSVREINELPWKGGSENNPDYECLRAELRKMAPPNGRAVLLFRSKCGCPVAKLEGWGTKRGRRHKKTLALNGKADPR